MKRGYAIVTGALGGLGTAITKRLIAAGIPVIGTDRRGADLDVWLNEALDASERQHFSFIPLDVTKEEHVNELAEQLRAGDEVGRRDQRAGALAGAGGDAWRRGARRSRRGDGARG